MKNGSSKKCLGETLERNHVFDHLQMCSMFDQCILTTEDFESAIQEGPTYICDMCWKFEFLKSVIKQDALKYQTSYFNKFSTGKSDWICRSCHKSMLNKMPVQAQKVSVSLS